MLPTLTQIKANDHRDELACAARDHRARQVPTAPGDRRQHRVGVRVISSARAAARIAAVGCVLALAAVAVADAAGTGVVVGPHAKIAGQGYGQWLRNSWQLALSRLPRASACQSERVNGTTVAMLIGGYSGKPESHSCRIHTGTPIYVNGLSAECSTVEQPPFHGTTATELRRCARHNLNGATGLAARIDGHRVRGYQALISASPVYSFHLPKHNLLGVAVRSGRSAAYGEGLLLRGLTPGDHTVHVAGKLPAFGFTYDVTYALHVGR